MFDADEMRVLREEIQKQVRIIASGAAGVNSAVVSENIRSLYPGHPTIEDAAVMHPYGYASRAPEDVIQVTARVGDHPANRTVLGHRADDRPTDIEAGETVIYSRDGYKIRVLNGKIEIGKGTEYEAVVMGETLRLMLIALIDTIVAHTHLGNMGFATSGPLNAGAFTNIKSENLDNKKILAEDDGRFA